jgi:formate dehydrogenase subunit delta
MRHDNHELRMANQIAANFAHHPLEQASGEVAAFLKASWTREMLARLASTVDEGNPEVDPIVVAALHRLRAPEPSP